MLGQSVSVGGSGTLDSTFSAAGDASLGGILSVYQSVRVKKELSVREAVVMRRRFTRLYQRLLL
jgi:ABC-type sugar transport system ATPase subunit